MKIPVELKNASYDIVIERGVISKLRDYIDVNRKVLIITDDGVPAEYAEKVAQICPNAFMACIPQGESSKSLAMYETLQEKLLENEFSRQDAIIGVGGGVVLDLSGFVAATYMRGIDFYGVPTTLLSQLDSSVGGKTAINFNGVKNILGSFREPKGVFIDPDTLKTLDGKQVQSGMAEGIKIAATSSESLFEFLEKSDADEKEMIFDELIPTAIQLKMDVVMKDEYETFERRILNFGHTIGHGIEALSEGTRTHGECVALGMVLMAEESSKTRIEKLLHKFGLPTQCEISKDKILEKIRLDKKKSGNDIFTVRVSQIGKGEIVKENFDEFQKGFCNQ